MSFMPEVKMDFIESENEEDIDLETEEENPNFIHEEDPPSDIEDNIQDVMAEVKHEKDELDLDDVFVKERPKVTEKLTKKGVPRKKRPPMSDAHKEKLKFAREKAMISRKKNAAARAEAKSLDKEEKELLTKQKVKRVKKLKEEVEESDEPKILAIKEPSQSFSKKDLEDAQLEAIVRYETMRKERKKVKQAKLVEDKVEKDFRDQLRRAVTPTKPFNPYSGCY
tara:strand:- start:488 stop:1159 length:672 start_codon:yes stop_codon:yes gene_type:complete